MTNFFSTTPLLLRGLFGSLLFLLFLYFIFLNYRDYKNTKQIKLINEKVRQLISGNYSEKLRLKASPELSDLLHHINDLSDVVRMTHENLAQETNRLTNVLSYMTDGVLATDRQGQIVLINDTAQKQLNVSHDQAYQMSIMDFLEDDAYSFNDLITQLPDLVLYRRNEFDEFITLRVKFALNRRESGFVSGLIAVLHDVTEQEKEERERRLFVSNVSHELRTPLTSVKSYLEALDDGALTEPVAPSFIKVSLDETNRMMRMITDLLSLSRIDNDNSTLEVELINFTAFMTYILNRFDQIQQQNSVPGKRYDIIRDYPLRPVWIEIDTDKMTQVIDNIMNNAIKYSPDGGQIIVTMNTTETQLIISISDQGLGIPKKDLPLIFDRFYRVDKARSRAQGGTGLGLAITKEIVKQHNGFIWAKSDYGKGSTFTIVLPYDKETIVEDEWEDEQQDNER